jgi:hypothetical protein
MSQSPTLEFRSSSFPVIPGEDEETNPGIFGKSLATWLAQHIKARGFETGEIIAEDFGWCVPVRSQAHHLYIACSSEDNHPQSWRVFVFAEGGLLTGLFGRDKSLESVGALYWALKELLASSTEIQDLHVEEDDS